MKNNGNDQAATKPTTNVDPKAAKNDKATPPVNGPATSNSTAGADPKMTFTSTSAESTTRTAPTVGAIHTKSVEPLNTDSRESVTDEDDVFRRVNPEHYFWKPSTEVEKDGETRVIRHKLTGMVLVRLRRKPDMNEPDLVKRNTPKFYYLVCLTKPCVASDHENISAERPRGSIIWVDERFNLAPMKVMLPTLDEAGEPISLTEVEINPIKKVPTAAGQNVWKVELGAIVRKANSPKLIGLSILNPAQARALTEKTDDGNDEPGGYAPEMNGGGGDPSFDREDYES